MLVILTAMNFIGMFILLLVFMNIKAKGIHGNFILKISFHLDSNFKNVNKFLDAQQSSANPMPQFPVPPPYMMDSTTSQLLKSQTPVNIHIYSINAYGGMSENQKFPSKPMNHVLMFENIYCK